MVTQKIGEILAQHLSEYVVIRYQHADNTGLVEGIIGGVDAEAYIVELKNRRGVAFFDYHAFAIFSVEIRSKDSAE